MSIGVLMLRLVQPNDAFSGIVGQACQPLSVLSRAVVRQKLRLSDMVNSAPSAPARDADYGYAARRL